MLATRDESSAQVISRQRRLQALGILSGLTAGAWLGAAEAPTKLVAVGLSPVVISLIMVVGVFLARWSLPALILGTASIEADIRRAPHLIIWALLAGCMWAVANTMTIFAIRDIGLSIAFPLWNSNSLLGILWGVVFFGELRQAGWRRWAGVLGGAVVMCVGAAMLAIASSTQAPVGHSMRGVWAALGAGVLWGTMYVPYRKAYLSGMNPLSFVTFFTFGELGMMAALAVGYLGLGSALAELSKARDILFWLMARRLYLGCRGYLSAICREIFGHKPRYSPFKYEPALGTVVGASRFQRVARQRHGDLHTGRWRLVADDGWGSVQLLFHRQPKEQSNGNRPRSANPALQHFRPTTSKRVCRGCNLREKLRLPAGC